MKETLLPVDKLPADAVFLIASRSFYVELCVEKCHYPGCSGKHRWMHAPFFDDLFRPSRVTRARAARRAGHKHVRAAYRRARYIDQAGGKPPCDCGWVEVER